ncbi:MAG TPA: hypothetical protein V6C97_21425, partial [Oculatellaceae cyanobacterium]
DNNGYTGGTPGFRSPKLGPSHTYERTDDFQSLLLVLKSVSNLSDRMVLRKLPELKGLIGAHDEEDTDDGFERPLARKITKPSRTRKPSSSDDDDDDFDSEYNRPLRKKAKKT